MDEEPPRGNATANSLLFVIIVIIVTYAVLSHRLTRLDRFIVAIQDSRNARGNKEIFQLLKTEGKTALEELNVILTCTLCRTGIIESVISNINVSCSPPQDHSVSAINSFIVGLTFFLPEENA